MKKIALLVIAFALIIGMTQCKKKAATPVSDNSIQITLSANNGGDEKTSFDGEGFIWSGADEYIYVGGNNASGCIGTLQINVESITDDGKKADFTGSIDNSANNSTLYFFYLGKSRGGSAVTTLDFSKQDGTLKNVTDYHIAIGSASYDGGSTILNVRFDMKMAIARFNTSGFDGSVYIHGDGIYSAATVDYNAGTITGKTKGFNLIGAAGENCYVAMIPQASPKETVVKFESGGHTGEMTFVRGIKENMYYCDNGGSLAVSASAITGVVKGLFSVEGTNGIPTKMVRFAPGNLQWSATGGGTTPTEHNVAGGGTAAGTWRFAKHQYDFVGNATIGSVYGVNGNDETKCNNLLVAEDYKGWIDMLCWAASGWNSQVEGVKVYQPYQISNNNADYLHQGFTGSYAYADWGVYNEIYNPINDVTYAPETWRTPTKDEWIYIIGHITGSTPSHRLDETAPLYAKAKVGSAYGLILFPDSWNNSTLDLMNINDPEVNYPNVLTIDLWNEILEPSGCVFLPAAGYLQINDAGSISFNWLSSTDGSKANGYYWSSQASSVGSPYRINMYHNKLCDDISGGINRGRLVRLIRTVD